MKKFTLLFVGVLVSAFTFAGPTPKTSSGMAIVRRDQNSFKLIYKSEEVSDVRVEIYDQNEKLVFSETIRKSDGFVRPYNFSELAEGRYTVKLDNGSNWMTETINYSRQQVEKLAQLIHLSDGKYLLTVAGEGEDVLNVRISDESGETVHRKSIPVFGNFAQVYDMTGVQGEFAFEITDGHGASKTLRK